MVQIEGTYDLLKNEHFVEYLTDLGLPEEHAVKADSVRPNLVISIDGKKISLNSNSKLPSSSASFILNEEVDDSLPTGDVLKSTASIDGNKLIIHSKANDGRSGVRTYEFSDKELVLTLTSTASPVEAKRFYKRV